MTWVNWYGLAFVAAIMIPNIAFAMTHRDGFENLFRNRTVEVLEQIGRFGCFFLMVIQPETLCRDDWFTGATQVYLWLGAALVLLYCAGWVVFWREDSVRKALALSILPSVLFLESGILRCYFPLIAAALLLFNYVAARSYSAPFMLTALAALQEYRREERFSWLVLTAAAIGVGTYVSPEILWFGLVLWIPPLALEILRFAKFGRAAVVPYLLPVLLGLPLMTALFALLTQVPGMVVAWQHPIPRYTVEYFWRLRLKMWKELLTLPTGELPQMGFVDPLLLLYVLYRLMFKPCEWRDDVCNWITNTCVLFTQRAICTISITL